MEVDYKLRLCLGPINATAVVAVVFDADEDVPDMVQDWLHRFKRLCSAPNFVPAHVKAKIANVGVDFCVIKVIHEGTTTSALAFELLDQVQCVAVHTALEATLPYTVAYGWRNVRLAYLHGWH